LPAGVVVLPNGTLEGRPTQDGVFVVRVTVTDSSEPPATASRNMTLTILRVAIVTQSFPNWTVGESVVAAIALENGSNSTRWNLTGELPPGLRLDEMGVIRGTPTRAGEFLFTVKVGDPANPLNSDARSYVVTVDPAPGKNPTGGPLGGYEWLLLVAALAVLFLIALGLLRRRRGPDENR
jgi:hypothetical protein